MIDAGDIGVPRVAWCRELRGPFQKKSENWILDARRSGGTLVDKNCHHFDLMNWWLGARPWRVCAFGGKATGSGVAGAHQVADHAVVIFEYRSGARGSLDLCLFAPETGDRGLTMGVAGSEGFLRTRLATLEIQWWRRGEKESRRIQVQAPRGEGWGGHLGFQEIHREFLRAVQEGNPPLTSPAACADGTRLAIAAEESISSGRVVEIV